MKLLSSLAIFLFSFGAFAFELKVDNWKKDRDLDRSIELITQTLAQRVTLDCQSFIQGVWIGQYEEARVTLMDPDHCVNLINRIKQSIKSRRSHCIEIDEEVKKDYRCR